MARVLNLLGCILCALVSSCSLTALDEVQAEACIVGVGPATDFSAAHALCADRLGPSMPLDDACEAHVCALRIDDQAFCTIAAPDMDGDGVGAADCVSDASGLPRDCDDSNPAVAEGKSEICDGLDNDCDGRVDEDALIVGESSRVSEPDGDADNVVFGAGPGGTLVAAQRRDTGEQLLFTWREGSAPRQAGTFNLRDAAGLSDDPGLAAVGLPSGEVLASFSPIVAGCTQMLTVASIDGATVSSGNFETGLPDTGGAVCPERTEAQRAPAVAFSGTRRLVAWLAAMRSGTPATAGVRLAGGSTTDGVTIAGPALDGGTALNRAGPAVLGLDPSLGFVLAVAEEDGLFVALVDVDGSGAVSIRERVEVTSDEVDELTLAAGPTADGTTQVGIAWRLGEGNNGRVAMARLAASADGLVVGETTEAGDEPGQAAPALAYSDRPRGWLLAWTERSSELHARMLGQTEGTASDPMRLFGAMDVGATSGVRSVGVAARTDGGFGVATHARGGDDAGIYVTFLGCDGS